MKLAFPKYSATWYVNTVLKELEAWTPTEKLTLKEISMKVCMLTALLSGQRCQTLQALKILPLHGPLKYKVHVLHAFFIETF